MAFSILELDRDPGVNERLRTVIGLAAVDKDFRARLIREPKAVLREIGVTVPDSVELVMHDTPRGAIGISLAAPQYKE